MPLFTSAIPMPTSVTIMDPCDPSMHITDLNPEFVNRCTHRSHNRPRAALLNEIASRTPCGNGATTGLSEVQQARLQPRPSATRSALSLDGLVKSPAPDEYIDHMSATNTTTTSSRLPEPDDSPVPGMADLQIIITSRVKKVRRICDGEDVMAPHSHAKRTRSTVLTVVALDIGATIGTFCVEILK